MPAEFAIGAEAQLWIGMVLLAAGCAVVVAALVAAWRLRMRRVRAAESEAGGQIDVVVEGDTLEPAATRPDDEGRVSEELQRRLGELEELLDRAQGDLEMARRARSRPSAMGDRSARAPQEERELRRMVGHA